MNQNEISDFLRDNLRIEIRRDWDGDLEISLKLGDEEISKDYISSSTLKSIVEN